MDNEEPLHTSASLARLTVAALLIVVVACRSPMEGPGDSGTIPNNQFVLAHSWALTLSIESTEAGLVVKSEGGAVDCWPTANVIRSWSIIEELTSNGEPYRRRELALDPNLESFGVVIGMATKLSSEEFEIRQLTGEASMEKAVGAINDIIMECGMEERLICCPVVPSAVSAGGIGVFPARFWLKSPASERS